MTLPLWAVGLLATATIQMAGSFMSQSLPVVAPLMTAGIGVGREQIGAIYALNSLGSVLFMAFGTPLVVRAGPLRALRLGTACGALALALLTAGSLPLVLASALLLGLAYGPAPPASTRILAATAIERHRGLIFSIKQAGAQAGGVLAGLLIAPIAAAWGWRAGVAVPVAVGLLAAIAIGPCARRLEVARDPAPPARWADLLRWGNLRAPFAAVASKPELAALTALTASLAVVQGCLFSFCVTYLVAEGGMAITAAGLAYACMQGGGMLGRILIGWVADRTGDALRNMIVQAWASAALAVVWAVVPQGTGLAAIAPLAFAMGLVCASWPGLMLAEISRLAPAGRIADAASGSTLITFCGYVAGPMLFSFGVRASGGWVVPYAAVAAQMALVAAGLGLWARRRRAA